MFGSWFRGPDAETVTLETIGLVKGAKSLDGGQGNSLGNIAAEKHAKKIDKVLARDKHVLDRDIRDFLTTARDGLRDLLGTEPSYDTGRRMAVHPPVTMPVHAPNPRWRAKYHAMQKGLTEQAGRIFDKQFAYDIVSEHRNKDRDQLKRLGERDIGVKTAMVMGKL